jgi:16S rRNA (guanine966-N2)-methyltransferase
MRIIGGSAAGSLLKVPQGFSVRPTPDLVRQAVFNSLGVRVPGARVLDLFSGSGAIGLECLSRGADYVISVEQSSRHAATIRENHAKARLPSESFELRIQDVFPVIRQLAAEASRFDLVLADPPFGEKNLGRRSDSLSQQLLDDPLLPSLLAPEGLFVLGHTKRDTLSLPAPWEEVKVLRHGDSMMKFLRVRREP